MKIPGDGGFCIETRSEVPGTVNRTRGEVGILDSISLLRSE